MHIYSTKVVVLNWARAMIWIWAQRSFVQYFLTNKQKRVENVLPFATLVSNIMSPNSEDLFSYKKSDKKLEVTSTILSNIAS